MIIDVVLNHMARPCPAAQELLEGTPCAPRPWRAYVMAEGGFYFMLECIAELR